jgi:hypothetical protein
MGRKRRNFAVLKILHYDFKTTLFFYLSIEVLLAEITQNVVKV